MCRSGVLVHLSDRPRAWTAQLTRIILAGVAAGTAAMVLFMVIHSLLIFPIWTRIGNGLSLALIGGIVNGPRAAWLFAGFLPIVVGAGIVLALVRGRLAKEDPS